MEANETVKREITELLDAYAQSYQDKDLDGILQLFVEDDDLVAIGTGYDEWVNGKNELRSGLSRDIEQAERVEVKFRNLTFSAAGDVAWAAGHMNMDALVNGQEIFIPGRLSAVFEKRNGKWLISHLHYSVPATEQEEGKAWPDM